MKKTVKNKGNSPIAYFCLASIFMLFVHPLSSAYATENTDKKPVIEFSDKRKAELVHMVKQDCGSCHGMTLKGGLGPALLPENLQNKSELFIQNTIFYGRPGTAMPPWQPILSRQEIVWISQQLKQGLIANK